MIASDFQQILKILGHEQNRDGKQPCAKTEKHKYIKSRWAKLGKQKHENYKPDVKSSQPCKKITLGKMGDFSNFISISSILKYKTFKTRLFGE